MTWRDTNWSSTLVSMDKADIVALVEEAVNVTYEEGHSDGYNDGFSDHATHTEASLKIIRAWLDEAEYLTSEIATMQSKLETAIEAMDEAIGSV